MIRVAIVDDDLEFCQKIQEYVEQYEFESREKITLSTFGDGDEIVNKYKPNYDIILMDIRMKFLDGMRAAEEIRKIDSEVLIIFITNDIQYAVKGYAVDAMDYMVKPLLYPAFSQCMNRAFAKLKKRKKQFVTIKTKGGIVRVEVSDICRIESCGHNIVYYTNTGKYESTRTLKEIEEEMQDYNLFKVNKGSLVNMEYVDSMHGNSVMVDGEEIVISRSRRKEFVEALTAYWGEEVK